MRNETSGDLISRSALGIGKAKRECFEDPKYADGWNSAVEIVENAPAVDAVDVGSCDGCNWKEIGRQQKCSCCRRNRYLKDCYEAKMEG